MSKSLIPVLAAPADAPKAETKAEVEVDSTITAKADAPKAEAEVCAEVLVTSTTTQVPANANTETDVPKAETLANTPLKIEEVRVVPRHVSLYHRSYSLSHSLTSIVLSLSPIPSFIDETKKKTEDKGNNNNKPAVVEEEEKSDYKKKEKEEESKEEVSRKRKSMGESATTTSVVVRKSIGPHPEQLTSVASTLASTITKKNIDKDDDKISYENTNICPSMKQYFAECGIVIHNAY